MVGLSVSHPHVGDIAGFKWLVCLSHTHMLGILLGLNGWSVCLTPTCWGYCWVSMVGLSVSHPHVGDIAGFKWLVCLSHTHMLGILLGLNGWSVCLTPTCWGYCWVSMVGLSVSHPHVGDIAGFEWLVCLSHTHMLGILLGLNGWSVCLTPTCWGYCWVSMVGLSVSHPHVGDIAGFEWLVCLSHTHMLGILLGLNGWSVCLTPTCWGYCWV